jgi:hypothetical protein
MQSMRLPGTHADDVSDVRHHNFTINAHSIAPSSFAIRHANTHCHP